MTAIRMLVPGNVRHRSGGNVYNARLAEHLAARGARAEVIALDGGWPASSAADRRRLAAVLTEAGADVVIMDGMVAGGAPREIEAAAGTGRRIWVLVHMVPPDHASSHRRAWEAATGVICASRSASADISTRFGLRAHVAEPGTDEVALPPSPPSQHRRAPHLVMVAALLPNKDQALVVEALAGLRDLPWTAALVGSTDVDPAYAAAIQNAITAHGLQSRIRITGELAGDALEEQWRGADLSLLASRSESFGMVVTESLAHGIPVLVRAGTGAAVTLGPQGAGAAVDLSEGPDALEEALRKWLCSPELRGEWRDAALAARPRLVRWEDTAAKVLTIVDGEEAFGDHGAE